MLSLTYQEEVAGLRCQLQVTELGHIVGAQNCHTAVASVPATLGLAARAIAHLVTDPGGGTAGRTEAV